MECVFVGHSYIRRLRDHYLPRRFPYRDVRPHHVERARELAKELELDNQFAGAYTAADDIVFIRELEHTRRTIATVKPGVVVIDIGTNNIARLTADDHVAILNLVTRVYEFARSLHVSLVVVNVVIPRCKGSFSVKLCHYIQACVPEGYFVIDSSMAAQHRLIVKLSLWAFYTYILLPIWDYPFLC